MLSCGKFGIPQLLFQPASKKDNKKRKRDKLTGSFLLKERMQTSQDIKELKTEKTMTFPILCDKESEQNLCKEEDSTSSIYLYNRNQVIK